MYIFLRGRRVEAPNRSTEETSCRRRRLGKGYGGVCPPQPTKGLDWNRRS